MSATSSNLQPRKRCQACQAALTGNDGLEFCPGCLRTGLLEVFGGGADPLPASGPGPARRQPNATHVGEYEIIDEVGRGGMGIVYKARHTRLQRFVALKIVHPAAITGFGSHGRLRAEAELAANLDYPNIVPVYDVGENDGRAWFTMKFIEGGNLAELMHDLCLASHPQGPLSKRAAAMARPRHALDEAAIPGPWEARKPQWKGATAPERIASLMAKVSRAVHHAHQKGVLHRDIKPSNILVDPAGDPHVTDFGIARRSDIDPTLAVEGLALGTPSYIAPEVARNGSAGSSVASDVYGLGAVLYHLLAGHPPFDGASPSEAIENVCTREVIPPSRSVPSAPADLQTICLKCLEKNPTRRYPSAMAVAEELERFLRSEPILANPATRISRLQRWGAKNLATVFQIAALLAAIAIGSYGYFRQWRRAEFAIQELGTQSVRLRIEHSENLLGQGNVPEAVAGLSSLLRDGHTLLPIVQRLCTALEEKAFLLPAGQPIHPGHPVADWDLQPSGRWAATLSTQGLARIWDLDSGAPVTDPIAAGPTAAQIRFAPNDPVIQITSADGQVRMWSLPSGKPVPNATSRRPNPADKDQSNLGGPARSPDGSWLALADQQTVLLCRTADPEDSVAAMNHPASVLRVAFSRDGSRLLTLCEDQSVYVWQIRPEAPRPPSGRSRLGGTRLSPLMSTLLSGPRTPAPAAPARPDIARPPSWLPDFAEAMAGIRLDEEEKVVSLSPSERQAILGVVSQGSSDDPWVLWARQRLQAGQSAPARPNRR